MLTIITKFRIFGIIQVNIEVLQYSICNLKYSIPKKTAFNNKGFNYDYNFAIKEIAEEFETKIYLFRKNY